MTTNINQIEEVVKIRGNKSTPDVFDGCFELYQVKVNGVWYWLGVSREQLPPPNYRSSKYLTGETAYGHKYWLHLEPCEEPKRVLPEAATRLIERFLETGEKHGQLVLHDGHNKSIPNSSKEGWQG